MWIQDVEQWTNADARKKAYETIEDINNGSNITAAIDENNRLIAIASYMTITSRLRLSMMQDIAEDLRPNELVDTINKHGLIFIYRLSGNGKGGARKIIEDIQLESRARNRPIFLNSTDMARSFYVRMGMLQIADSNHYYWMHEK